MSKQVGVVARGLSVVLLAAVVGLSNAATAEDVGPPPVTVQETADAFILSNGILTARILKQSGDLRSLRYGDTEVLTDRSGHAGGYWSHDTIGGKETQATITIDPATNDGERAEVAVIGISGGIPMGHGPGTPSEGDFAADIEIRYALGRDDSAIYTYCIFDHLPEYPAATMSEARFAVKLADYFDWMSIDEHRNRSYPEIDHSEDKYVFTALQSENRAYGFASTDRKIGFYLINPNTEYLSGGPTKPEFLCHRDTTRTQAPVVLNYWRSSHYGGANVSVEEGERWTKVIGPFLLYVNEGGDPDALWNDAKQRAAVEAKAWPYGWVDATGYAKPAERGTVTGQLVLDDPQFETRLGKFWVGLAHSPYSVPGWRGLKRPISWQTDAKHYQFWMECEASDGAFEISNVAPGTYTLYAMADGVLGEFAKADIAVDDSATVDLGELRWTPVRRGKQLWEIGIPNRTATEFAGSDRYFDPRITLEYPQLFPDDVTFTIGKSSPAKDWFFAHVPHNIDAGARVLPYRGVSGHGRATPYTIRFDMDDLPSGRAVLRLAICGTGTRSIDIDVNGQPAGEVRLGMGDGVITRHQIQGLWYERELECDASLLREGDNTLTLTVPAGPVNNGVVYDYLRLELVSDEGNGEEPPQPKQRPDAEAWKNQPPTNTDEASVRDYTLPDPLTTADGEKVSSTDQWEAVRRPELLKLFAEHQFGVTPTKTIKPTVEVIERDAEGLDGAARRSQARLHFGEGPDAPTIRVLRYVPADAKGPVPTLLYIGFSPNCLAVDEPGIDEGMAWDTRRQVRVPDRETFSFGPFNAKFFIDRGYGLALVYYGDIEPDFDHGGRHGVRSLFGATGDERDDNEWGAIGGWSWGLSRVLDYLETDPAVDSKQVALAGVSRLGKTVIWAGAQDERFALVMPLLSGEGGAAISRRNFGETVADLTNPERFDYWYTPNYATYAFDVDALPVDGHELVALIAPRPILHVVGSEDTWSDAKGEWVAAKAAEPVYELYGLQGPDGEEYPPPNTFLSGDIGYYVHEGGHRLFPKDLEVMADFMDQHFQRPEGEE
ncbi:polysaccharide lyase family protein [Aeoliella sp. ICT_H6.2]|uniref:rhamnogalacturonan endolyase n=1 Tax=Aeoliella straminimaris TaxID=2954799 RepID=A0A9X2F910_9BACT|nr:polysaccharide lyase family protein [Aeoliella straminimaris]MCO6044079.1 polysaccharide lyase family protein [Aeoliella straminimaris]